MEAALAGARLARLIRQQVAPELERALVSYPQRAAAAGRAADAGAAVLAAPALGGARRGLGEVEDLAVRAPLET